MVLLFHCLFLSLVVSLCLLLFSASAFLCLFVSLLGCLSRCVRALLVSYFLFGFMVLFVVFVVRVCVCVCVCVCLHLFV